MNQHTHIGVYVDGVETDINTLGDFQDMLVFIISEYTSYTVVKTYIMDKLYYYGICAATYVDKSSTIAITIDTESDRGYKSPLPELDILAKHMYDVYGNKFPSNIHILSRIVKATNTVVSAVFDENKLIAHVESIDLTKRAI